MGLTAIPRTLVAQPCHHLDELAEFGPGSCVLSRHQRDQEVLVKGWDSDELP